jgi:nucleolar protein 14
MQRRNKVGGIMDRRFGENDPTMAPEEKMLERFTQEKQRRYKNSSAFDLDDDEDQGQLTHMGQSLSLDGPTLADDFDEEDLAISETENHSPSEANPRKRRLSEDKVPEDESAVLEEAPERKKTKQEVMKEIIAKSKLYKYERQAIKDEDDDLREELDKDMQEIHALLQGAPPRRSGLKSLGVTNMNPERAALISGIDRTKFEKEYDLRLKELLQDKKSKPTERTKTNEEKLAGESRRLQELEAMRLRRMEGKVDDDDDNIQEKILEPGLDEGDEDYGLGSGIKAKDPPSEFGVEDEDDFVIDHDLVASGSDVDISDDETSSTSNENTFGPEDNDFLDGLLTEEDARRPEFLTGANAPIPVPEHPASNGVNGDLAYTFPCPQSHAGLLEITKGVAILDLPTVVRRIRALYHPQLKIENKAKLGKFAVSLVDHISYLANQSPPPSFYVLESLIRHSHSMAKTCPVEVANAFRNHLEVIHKTRALEPSIGDLVLLTAIGTIYPTSDHFHQVVTPSILTMARYMGQKIPRSLSAYVVGTYMATLCLEYQHLSKRYIPELVGFLLNTLCALAPTKLSKVPGCFHYHDSKVPRLDNAQDISVRKLSLIDARNLDLSLQDEIALKLSLLETSLKVIGTAADVWTGKPAFQEVFDPALRIIQHFSSKGCHSKLPKSIQVNTMLRK